MTAKLRTTQATDDVEELVPDVRLVASNITKASPRVRSAALDEMELDISRRRLRNRFILANAVVWIAIIMAIRLVYF